MLPLARGSENSLSSELSVARDGDDAMIAIVKNDLDHDKECFCLYRTERHGLQRKCAKG